MGPVATVVAPAIISGVSSLLGGGKQAKSAKSAAQAQERMAREALAEQRRIYDLEAAKEERDRIRREGLEDTDRKKALEDEQRVLGSRRNAFGGFGADLDRFSKGYAPAYGQSAEQAAAMVGERNAGFAGGSGGGPVAPRPADKGMGPGPDPMAPNMPQMGGTGFPGQMQGPGGPAPSNGAPAGMTGGGAMTSTVWLQAPTGETMEVPIDQAPAMIAQGAVLIAPPVGGSNGLV